MKPYQREFIQLAIEAQALKFGEFTLKSGRVSPYFFNAGLFNNGKALNLLGKYYAEAILACGIEFDILFGPAYKGIPLASATAVCLAEHHAINTPWAFNRKEAKDHGEGGNIVGAPLQGKALIIDDVITAGTAIREVIRLIQDNGSEPAGVLVALDRQERGQANQSAIQEIETEYGIPVYNIVNLDNLLDYLEEDEQLSQFAGAVADYRNQYGVA